MAVSFLNGLEVYQGVLPEVVDSPLHRIPEGAPIRSKFMGGACFVPLEADLRSRSKDPRHADPQKDGPGAG